MTECGNYREISRGLVALLIARGLTPQDIATATGVTKSFISRVRAGTRSFTLDHLVKLERHIGEPLPVLLMHAVPMHTLTPELRAMYQSAMKVFSGVKSRKKVARSKAA